MVHSPTDAITPLHKFEAHPDGASTTALAWNGLVLVTGSSRGTVQVFDGISFESLRSFPSPVLRLLGGARTTAHIVGGNEEQDRQGMKWGSIERERRADLGPGFTTSNSRIVLGVVMPLMYY